MKDISHPELRLFHLPPSDAHFGSIRTQSKEQKESQKRSKGLFISIFTGHLNCVLYECAVLQISVITRTTLCNLNLKTN